MEEGIKFVKSVIPVLENDRCFLMNLLDNYKGKYNQIQILIQFLGDSNNLFTPNFGKFYEKEKNVVSSKLYLHTLIISTVCQYIEELGAYALASKESPENYGKKIINYKPDTINNFFQNVVNLTEDEIWMILSYPQKDLIENEIRERFELSCRLFKEELLELDQFRKKYNQFYMAYKHGNRILHSALENVKDSTLIPTLIFFNRKGRAKPIYIADLQSREEYKHTAKRCFHLLEIMVENYRTKVRLGPIKWTRFKFLKTRISFVI